MLSGQRDAVVPPAHMRELWQVAVEATEQEQEHDPAFSAPHASSESAPASQHRLRSKLKLQWRQAQTFWRKACRRSGFATSDPATVAMTTAPKTKKSRRKRKDDALAAACRGIRTANDLEKFGFVFRRSAGPAREGRFVELPYGSHSALHAYLSTSD